MRVNLLLSSMAVLLISNTMAMPAFSPATPEAQTANLPQHLNAKQVGWH